MALMGFGDIDDVFGRVDHMMNSMMRGMFDDPFGMHGSLMSMPMSPFMSHQSMFGPQAMQSFSMSASPGSSGYYSSSVTTMSCGPDGRPHVYSATNAETYAPGGVRESRSTVQDSRSGLQQMSIGHHIRDRGHVMQQSRNAYTGEREENNEFINLEEDEEEIFENEWRQRMSVGRRHRHDAIDGSRRHHHRHHREEPRLAITAPASPDPEPIVEFPPDSPPPTASSSRCPSRSGSTSGKERKSRKREKKPYKK